MTFKWIEVSHLFILQIYRELLQITREPPMFSASSGLLLRDDLHHAFDRLELSFYCKVSCRSALLMRVCN